VEESGRLLPGGRLIESSSGNLAIGLAMLARDRGYHFTAVVDPKITAENLDRLRNLGASTHLVDTPDETGSYLPARLDYIREALEGDRDLVWTDQYSNRANPLAHYTYTAPELYQQMEEKVDAVFVAVSTGGTLAGIGRYFRQVSPHTRIIAVDARGSAALGGVPGNRKLVGIGSSRRASFLESGFYDDLLYIEDCEAFAFCRALDKATGIRIGGSSGACLAACARMLERHGKLERAVCLCADRGENYASSIYSDTWLARNKLDVAPRHLGQVDELYL
jgi:2,3-diaminopropionate biosynthesis protein SbnA